MHILLSNMGGGFYLKTLKLKKTLILHADFQEYNVHIILNIFHTLRC